MNTYYIVDGELLHYGVPGMKWGVRRDRYRANKASRYARVSTNLSNEANYYAKRRINDSDTLEKAEKYMRKANKTASKIQDKDVQKSIQKDLSTMNSAHKEAGKNYVERSKQERITTLVTNVAVSTGASFVAVMAGSPVGFVYASSGPKYNLKEE